MSFNLPITIELASEAELHLAGLGICPRCALAQPPLIEGRPRENRTLELKHVGGGHHWYQCRGCLRVYVLDRTAPPPPSRDCPRCGRETFNPTDIAQGYCGACHAWT